MPFLTDRLKQYPADLFDFIKKEMNLKNDAELSRLMGINQATLSRMRYQVPHSKNNAPARVASQHLLALYDGTGISIEELRTVLFRQEFVKQAVTPREVAQAKIKADNAIMAERQRIYRESIKNVNSTPVTH